MCQFTHSTKTGDFYFGTIGDFYFGIDIDQRSHLYRAPRRPLRAPAPCQPALRRAPARGPARSRPSTSRTLTGGPPGRPRNPGAMRPTVRTRQSGNARKRQDPPAKPVQPELRPRWKHPQQPVQGHGSTLPYYSLWRPADFRTALVA